MLSKLRTNRRNALIAVFCLSVVAYSLLFGGASHTISASFARLHLVRAMSATDAATQQAEAKRAMMGLRGAGQDADYSYVQAVLAPVGGCPSGPAGGTTNALISQSDGPELEKWIEAQSSIVGCLKDGQLDNALLYYSWVVEHVRGVSLVQTKLGGQVADALILRAYARQQGGQQAAALRDWNAAQRYIGKDYDLFVARAEAAAGTHREAQQALLAADVSNVGSASAILALAQSYNVSEQPGKAKAVVTPLLTLAPADTRVWQQYGQSLIGLNQLGPAEDALRHAVDLKPDDVQALNRLGVFYMSTGRLSQAEETLTKAASAGPDAYWVWDHLGDVLAREGKPDSAAAAYRTAVSAAPSGAKQTSLDKLATLAK